MDITGSGREPATVWPLSESVVTRKRKLKMKNRSPLGGIGLGATLLLIFAGGVGLAQDARSLGETGSGQEAVQEEPPPVPEPDLSGLEPAVAAQLREARDTLTRSLQIAGSSPRERAENFGLMGELYHAYKIAPAAAACYRNALALVPNSFRWVYLLAHLSADGGDFDEASRLYRKAIALNPESLGAQVALGNIYLQQNQLAEAQRCFLEGLRLDRNSAAASFGLAQIALSQKNYADAVGLFQKTLALAPEANAVHYPLALAYRALGLTDEANRHLQRRGSVGVVAKDPLIEELESRKQGEVVLLLRGKTAFQARRFREAAELFLQAAEADPGSSRARVNAGAALAAMGDAEGAEKQIRLALEIAPDDFTANFNLGVLARGRGEVQTSLNLLQKAVDLAPGDEGGHLELGKSLLASGNPDGAKKEFEIALGINRANEEARLLYVQTLISEGNFGEAKKRLEEEHSKFPSDGRTAFALAKILAACPDPTLRDGKTALELALRVFNASNTVGHAQLVAEAFAELGNCEKAAEWIDSTLKAVNGAEGLDPSLADRLRVSLIRYRQGPPCRPAADPSLAEDPKQQ